MVSGVSVARGAREAREAREPRRFLRDPAGLYAALWRRLRGRSNPAFVPRPNWFFAFPIDGAFVLDLPEPPTSIRRYHAEDVHLTLAFLGGVGEAGAERALAALDRELGVATPRALEVSLDEVIAMGSRQKYSALSALLARGRKETSECISALRDALTEAASGRREKRAAKPHVTIARPRSRATPDDRDAGLRWAAGLDLRAVSARLDRIALYTWSEIRRERLFKIVAERRLR
jgi:2'-5' RNA ligase